MLPDGRPYLVMPILRGETLAGRVQRSPLSRERALELFDGIADGVAALHDAGLVHRDLKPENVYLARRRDGVEVVKILDFGIARDLAGQDTVTQAGTAMGTPHYMSPEQAMSARDVTFSTDVWALGVMLYEWIVGKRPFQRARANEEAAAVLLASGAPGKRFILPHARVLIHQPHGGVA